jgi:hypothetical protein
MDVKEGWQGMSEGRGQRECFALRSGVSRYGQPFRVT